MWTQMRDWATNPLVGFAVGAVALVLAWKMTTTWANALLFIAWAILVASVFRVPILATLPLMPRMLWTAGAAAILGLAIYYTLWTDVSGYRLGVAAHTSRAVYPPGTTIAGIPWRPGLVELRLTLINSGAVDLTDLDIAAHPDEPVIEIAQLSEFPNVSFMREPAGEITQELARQTGQRVANPLVVLASTGYRIRCPTLPARGHLGLVLVVGRIRDHPTDPAAPPPPEGIFHKGYVLRMSFGDGTNLWLAHRERSDDVFLAGASPQHIEISGTYSVLQHKKTIAQKVDVSDPIADALLHIRR